MKRSAKVQGKSVTIDAAVAEIKKLIETAIRGGGTASKNAVIRSQKPINLLHDAVKSELIRLGVSPLQIRPLLGNHKGELKLSGRLKCKDQDVCVLPNNLSPIQESIDFDGLLHGETDNYGRDYTEHILTINVRSQLSSLEKNFDTLYERTFAETVNLHLRCPQMVMGELYMIPVKPYDDTLANERRIGFQGETNIEKYIKAFSVLNNRRATDADEHKYERVCLLIVDFSHRSPIIYDTTRSLKEAGLLAADSQLSIDEMNFPTFVSSLLNVYAARFGNGRLS